MRLRAQEDARGARARGGGGMTSADHERWEDAAGTYVLGALPDDERADYVAHLTTCPTCRAEVGRARRGRRRAAGVAAADAAAAGAEGADHGRGRARGRAAGVGQRAPPASRGQASLAQFLVADERRAALACVALLLGLGVGAVLFGIRRYGARSRSRPTRRCSRPRRSWRSTATRRCSSRTDSRRRRRARSTWSGSSGSDGTPEPTSALFTPRGDGSATASVTGDMDDVETVLVNTEQSPDVTAPTSPALLTATLS